jgi:hypothetical protein
MEEDRRLLNESRMLARLPIPETKLPIVGGNEGLLAALTDESKKEAKRGKEKSIRNSEILLSISGVLNSGISTGEKPSALGFPSKAQRARRRMESLSPRLKLSSLLEAERAGRDTPITSADSRRVDTDERRRWCDPRFVPAAEVEPSCEREEEEDEDEEDDSKTERS